MGIFDRLRRLVKANVNAALDKAEDPEKMLNQLIVDMNQQLVEAKKAVATAIADEKRLERDIQTYRGQSAEWEKRAILAIREAERNPAEAAKYEDLARQALLRKKENDDVAGKLQEQFNAQHAAVERLKDSLRDLQRKMDEAQRRKSLLVARAKRAEAQKKIQEQITGMSDTSAFEAFEKMAQKVDQIESEADALAEIEHSTRNVSLDQEFAKLEAKAGGADMLEEFKQKVALEDAKKREQAKLSGGSTGAKPSLDAPNQQKNVVPAEVDLMMEELKRKLHNG